jgi:hypothetical protein
MVTIDLPREVEAQLENRAAERGITVPELVRELVEQSIASPNGAAHSTGDYLLRLAEDVRAGIPDVELRSLPSDWAKEKDHYRFSKARVE